MSNEIGVISKLTGTFYAFPDKMNDETVGSMLSHLGLSSSEETNRRLEMEKLERKLKYQERQQNIKKLVSRSRDKPLYTLLSEKTFEEHVKMHKDTKDTLDINETPSEDYNDDVWSLSDDDDEIVNFCPCFVCRPLLYSSSNHNKWKKEKEERQKVMIEEYKQELENIKENKRKKLERDLQRDLIKKQQEELTKIQKVKYMRENEILPSGWKIRTSTTFPGKRYYYNTSTGSRLWETLEKESFGWTVDELGCVRDIYTELK